MKYGKKVFVIAALLLANSANAATLSIDLTAQQASRFQAAVGADMRLKDAKGVPRAAIPEEARQDVIRYMRNKVLEYERTVEQQKVVVPTFDVE